MNRVLTTRRPTSLRLAAVTAVAAAAFAAAAALPSGGFHLSEAMARPQGHAGPDDGAVPAGGPLAAAGASLRAGRFADAYGRYAALADQGDERAAWMALAMVFNGAEVFGSEWSATPGQLSRWNRLASQRAARAWRVIPEHDRGE
jgi:hypothetical protein